MWKLFGNKKTAAGRIKRSYIIYAVAITAGTVFVAIASTNLISGKLGYIAAQKEYEMLSGFFPDMDSYLESLRETKARRNGDDETAEGVPRLDRSAGPDDSNGGVSDPLEALREINPDFIGWISIGDIMNYPVVLGENNTYYLDRTFTGKKNPAGTVFMDSRNKTGFDSVVCILYGHNMKDKTMFAQLHKYRESAYMEEHPDINIITSDGDILTYRIFAAKLVNDVNRAYRLNFKDYAAAARVFPNSPETGSRFLLLSTCTNSSYDFERLLVYAALVG